MRRIPAIVSFLNRQRALSLWPRERVLLPLSGRSLPWWPEAVRRIALCSTAIGAAQSAEASYFIGGDLTDLLSGQIFRMLVHNFACAMDANASN